MRTSPLVLAALFGYVSTQQIGNNKQETHLPLSLSKCTKGGQCSKQNNSVTLDANWRWIDQNGQNCYTGNLWDKQKCPDPKTCAQNCALEGVTQGDWTSTYGVTSIDDGIRLNFVTPAQYGDNIGSRLYMLDSSQSKYEMFKLKNREFSVTVDVSNLPCGLNGALYFVGMEETGNMGNGNNAGAKYGTGYCDAQCPHDVKFIDGQGNTLDWKTDPSSPNSGNGKWGSCCAELDIWEANSVSNAFTLHPCKTPVQYKCTTPEECGDSPDHRYDPAGLCDKDGCDFNSYRAGVTDFFGEGKTVDTTSPFQVITQFITDDGTDTGKLTEVRRVYVQHGKKIENPKTNIPGMSKQYDSITTEMCTEQKGIFGDSDDFSKKGGMQGMDDALGAGMVLVMSIWDDHQDNMLWLDSVDPPTKTAPGGPRGTCPTTSGVPADVERDHPDAYVMYSDVKVGDIGSTFQANDEAVEFLQ